MSTEEISQLVGMARAGDREALFSLWGKVRRHASRKAGRWTGHAWADRDDLMQAAYLALVEAVERFDPEAGGFFALFDFTLMSAFREAVFGGRTKRHERDPINTAVSMDEPILTEQGEEVDAAEIVADEAAEAAFDSIELMDAVQDALDALTEEERAILYRRFWGGLHRDQTAKVCRMEPRRVRRLEESALRKLRHPDVSKKLRAFYRL